MPNPVLKYKNYSGSVEVSLEDQCLFGRILFINDRIVYEGETPEALRASFEEAVDDYIATCEELGKSPEKPCSGQFQVRIDPEQHRKAVQAAYGQGITLNDLVKVAIAEFLREKRSIHHVHEHRYSFAVYATDQITVEQITAEEEMEWQPASPYH